MPTFGDILRAKRRAAGFSQRQLAERAGVDFSYISKMENGRLPTAAAETVTRLCQILGCPPEELLAPAKKMPADLDETLTAQPAALRFLQEASRLRLSQEEWERLLGKLHGLRDDPERRKGRSRR